MTLVASRLRETSGLALAVSPPVLALLREANACFWRYYPLCSAGFLLFRQGLLWQLVLSPAGGSRPTPYRSVRPGPCPLAHAGREGR